MPSQFSLLTVLLTATTLLCTGLPATAQSSRQPYDSSLRRQTETEYTVLYVNPLSGDDQLGAGTRYQPYKTITRALQIAQSGTVIVLAPGQYTRDNGESFPLQLRPGITLQGQPTTTQSVLIQGGGTFNSPRLSGQNATLVMADRSGLAYVVVSNPTPQGHGVWIESGQPVIRSSALVANEHTGLYVAGGSPIVEGSYFTHNGVAGLVLYGQARAVVRGNYFENTGTAITVGSEAYAEITDNRILRNEEGLVLLGNASPLIANNQIAQNQRNGVVEVALTTAPEIAAAEPGADSLSPAVASAPAADIPEAETPEVDTLERPDVGDVVEDTVSDELVATVPTPSLPAASTPLPAPESAIGSTPASSEPISRPAAPESPPSPTVVQPISEPAPVPVAVISEPTVPEEPAEVVAESADISAEASSSPSIAELRNRVRRRDAILALAEAEVQEEPVVTTAAVPVSSPATGGSIDIAVVPADTTERRVSPPAPRPRPEITTARRPVPTQSIPRSSNPGNRLSVPGGNIPVGSGGSTQFSPPANDGSGPPAPPSRASALGLTYRVFVEPQTDADRDRVRQIVPDAFRTQLDGQPLMQVGAYADEATAQERQQLLLEHGIDARVEYLP